MTVSERCAAILERLKSGDSTAADIRFAIERFDAVLADYGEQPDVQEMRRGMRGVVARLSKGADTAVGGSDDGNDD